VDSRISRRDFIRTVGVGATAFAMPQYLAAVPPGAGDARRRPNFLFLFTDDQRFDTIGAVGNAAIKTPNMDALVARGTAFTHAYIMGGGHGAICMPSRAMLLTGRGYLHLPDSVVATWNVPEEQRGECPYVTFPELLRGAGYSTYGIGKWHNAPSLYAKCFTGGASIFFGGMSDHLKVPVHDFDPSGEYPADKRHTGEKFSSELFSDAAVRFLKERDRSRPFLLYVSYTAPHDPRMAPKEFEAMYPPDHIPVPPNFLPEHPFDNGELKIRDEKLAPFPRTRKVVREHIAAYYAMITHLDAQIGRVIKAIDESGEADNTVIIFAGDNGLAVGQHGLMGKQNLYEHSSRVPLVLCGPGIPKGRKSDALCYLHDVFPTMCDLSGLPVPQSVESKSLMPLVKEAKANARDSVFLAYRHMQRGLRSGRWKLIMYNVGGTVTTQLFDLQTDPWEMTNLTDDPAHAARRKELRARLKELMKENGDKLDLDEPKWGHTL
jgi:arylsulfatase A-like enzyme